MSKLLRIIIPLLILAVGYFGFGILAEKEELEVRTRPAPKIIAKVVKHGDWNQITVTAIGDDITVSLNGVTVTELLGDTKCQKEGHIALQLHGGQDMHVEFKDIAILALK